MCPVTATHRRTVDPFPCQGTPHAYKKHILWLRSHSFIIQWNRYEHTDAPNAVRMVPSAVLSGVLAPLSIRFREHVHATILVARAFLAKSMTSDPTMIQRPFTPEKDRFFTKATIHHELSSSPKKSTILLLTYEPRDVKISHRHKRNDIQASMYQ